MSRSAPGRRRRGPAAPTPPRGRSRSARGRPGSLRPHRLLRPASRSCDQPGRPARRTCAPDRSRPAAAAAAPRRSARPPPASPSCPGVRRPRRDRPGADRRRDRPRGRLIARADRRGASNVHVPIACAGPRGAVPRDLRLGPRRAVLAAAGLDRRRLPRSAIGASAQVSTIYEPRRASRCARRAAATSVSDPRPSARRGAALMRHRRIDRVPARRHHLGNHAVYKQGAALARTTTSSWSA